MELDYAFFAQAADVSDGKIHIFGGDINTLKVPNFPVQVAPFALVTKFSVVAEEAGSEHSLSLLFDMPNGESTELLGGQRIETAPNADNPDATSGAVAIINLGIKFDEPGRYAIRILLDGQEVKSLPLYLQLSEELRNAIKRPQPAHSGK